MFHPLLLLCTLISLIIVFFVIVRPLFLTEPRLYRQQPSPDGVDYIEALGILEMLSDLENDFKMGRLTRADYESLALEYQHQYLEKTGTESQALTTDEAQNRVT
jgi:hypothetical protein